MDNDNNNSVCMSITQEIQDEVRRNAARAMPFLECHPAFNDNFSGQSFYWMIKEVCKRGISSTPGDLIVVNYWDKEAKKFESEFRKKYTKEELKKPFLCSLYKSYKQVYGEPWEFDHVEFWWETSFQVFVGDVSRDSRESYDPKKWQSYSHEEGGKLTFEECIVEIEKITRKTLGSFSESDFYSKEENENHKKYGPFLFKKLKEVKIKDEKVYGRTSIFNPKYFSVSNGMINRRWLKWFVTTEYCRKNWSKDFKEIVKVQPPNN